MIFKEAHESVLNVLFKAHININFNRLFYKHCHKIKTYILDLLICLSDKQTIKPQLHKVLGHYLIQHLW